MKSEDKPTITRGNGDKVEDERVSKYPGRRETDRCPYYPQNCRDVVATKEDIMPLKEKLDSWIFKLFIATFLPLAMTVLGWVAYCYTKSSEKLTRVETNQVHIMKSLNVPLPESEKGGKRK